MERLFVILTFECVMCFHSNTGDRCCVTRSFSGEICMGLKIYVRCCVATVSSKIIKVARRPGGGVLPYKRLIGMCRWMGSHFHDWSDYNGVAFSIDLLEWGRKFSDFWGK